MSLEFYINNQLIENKYIKQFPVSSEKITYGDQSLIASQLELYLDNTDQSIFDDRVPGSLFYAVDFYDTLLEIYDTETEKYFWNGLIKKLVLEEANNQIKLTTVNYIKNLAQKNCVYTNASNKTPAQMIYEILTDADNGNVPTTAIVYKGFQNAINIQTAASVYADLTFVESDNKDCLAVISELCNITQCHIFTIDNLIYLYQWEPYTGEVGTSIESRFVNSKSYSHEFDDSMIKNAFSVAYDAAGTVAYSTGSDVTSIAQYGKKLWNVPEDKPDSTTSTDFKILFRSSTAALWAGNLKVSRFKSIRKTMSIDVDDSLKFLNLNDQIDLNFDYFYQEPVRVEEKSNDKENNKITFKGIFLNTPNAVVERDVEPPAVPELYAVIPFKNGVYLKWSQNFEVDYIGNLVFWTESLGSWFTSSSHLGSSPARVPSPTLLPDGYVGCFVGQLTNQLRYYFKVQSYDNSYNYSADSNIMNCVPYYTSSGENFYRVDGDIVNGLILDINNSRNGTPPTGYPTYGTYNYSGYNYAPCSYYESDEFYNPDGWSYLRFGVVSSDKIKIKYKTKQTSSASWSSWSGEMDALDGIINFTGQQYFKFAVIFYSLLWSDPDKFYVKEVI